MKFFLLFSILLISCGNSPDKEKDEDGLSGPDQIIVGRIASVAKRGKFVLIQKLGTGTLPKGIIYQSRGPHGRTASLRPSGERVRDFFAADLVNGAVEKGDAVIAYTNMGKKETEEDHEMDSKGENDGETEENIDEPGLPKGVQEPQTIKD